jgi:5'-nucleotidase (lipoprotein e(P4) family)
VKLLKEGVPYSEELWQQWVDKGQALAMPGAAEFLNSVRARGAAVFYITNRVCDPANRNDRTMALLRSLQFPVDQFRLQCRADAAAPSDKSARRARVANTHRVLAMLGDDLNDFAPVPAVTGDWKARLEVRERVTEAYRDYWGTRWFMLPNPTYGSWERAIGEQVTVKLDALRQ